MKADVEKISSIMSAKGMFVKELSVRSGVSEHILKGIICGSTGVDISPIVQRRIAYTLGVHINEIFTEGNANG